MKRIAATLAMSTTLLLAGYKVDLDKLPIRTLPQETYGKLVKAKGWNGLSWAWKDEDYDHSLGWAIQSISFKSSKELPAPFQDYLKEALGKLEDRQSPYRLNLAVVDFGEITSWPKSGFVTVEGTVTLFGKPLAAFVTCETVTSKSAEGYKFQYAIDDVLKSFIGEIMLPQGGETIIPLAKPFPREVATSTLAAYAGVRQRLQEGIEALDKKNAFRDRPMGMPIEAFLGKGKVHPEQKRGLVILDDPKDDLDLGRARAKAIRYIFWKGKLARVEMEFPSGDQVAARIHQALKIVYGRGVWGMGTRPYLDGLTEVLRARGGYGRNPVAVNPIVWEGKQVSMMLDGLASGPEARRNVMGPVLLTLDCVPVVEAMRKELLEEDQARGAQKPNI